MSDLNYHTNLEDLFNFSQKGIYSQVLVKSDSYSYTLMCLAKGTDIDTHTSTKNGVVYCIKGSGSFVLKGEKISLVPGVFIFMPANAEHSLQADEDLAILLSLTV